MRSVFFLCPVLEELEYSWPLAEMVREAVVAETKDQQSRHHHYPHMAE
jgi:hypothetical protein